MGKPSTDEILDIATLAFGEKGYDGARVDEIAKAAGVNKATLYYRIGDKDALWAEVLNRIFTAKVRQLEDMLETVKAPEERLRTFARIVMKEKTPEQFGAIMLREIADGGRNLPDAVLPLMGRIVGTLEQIVAQGVEDGVFKPTNPFLLHMALVGGCTLYACNGPIRRRVAQNAPEGSYINTELSMEDAADTIAEMLMSGVRR
ncbi:TetR/AcrR family transcriptional regulator [Magnetovibrio sp. PR-2]|uniref:TetR/AcrR family transcriptional regulator n=1 Tax=Magnetovibrio sp. PR-2 TaxID=3120356 RepID=UPI002FCDFA22